MVFALSPLCCATSTKLTPSGVPAMGDTGPGGGATGFASYSCCAAGACCPSARVQGGTAMAKTSANGSTSAVRLSEPSTRRRVQLKIEKPPEVFWMQERSQYKDCYRLAAFMANWLRHCAGFA